MGKLLSFLKVNTTTFTFGTISYLVYNSCSAPVLFLWTVPMHYLLFCIVNSRNALKKDLLKIKEAPPDKTTATAKFVPTLRDARYVLMWCLLETWSHYYVNLQPTTSFLYELVTFIPKTFVFELAFDFCFYWQHYLLHKIPVLYQNIHKVHHQHSTNISTASVYVLHVGDLVLSTASILIAASVVPLYEYQYFTWAVYRILGEQAGHVAVYNSDSCFSQCIWLPRLLDIDLNNADHFQHHALNNCNYSKRFSLWDRVFGTFKPFYQREPFYKREPFFKPTLATTSTTEAVAADKTSCLIKKVCWWAALLVVGIYC
jgi:sterol desaturase/sphingolipid hydroxylase (fatty acid hydroxylase superfamily)